MVTYLLTWNPYHWAWTNLQQNISDIKKYGFHSAQWSCGVTKKIEPNDRIFLMKLGKEEPQGIIASGWAKSYFFKDKHWNKDRTLIGKTALYINVHFDTILDPQKLVFSKQLLNRGVYKKMNWEPQASGVTIPEDIATQLEIDWANFVGQPFPLFEDKLSEEVDVTKTYREGTTKQITINSYERNTEARLICIKHHGLNCAVCDFNFEKFYGQIGQNFIHVHHLRPLSEIRSDYELNPITDLRPVCPNCHAMLHKQKPAYTIQELKIIMEQASA